MNFFFEEVEWFFDLIIPIVLDLDKNLPMEINSIWLTNTTLFLGLNPQFTLFVHRNSNLNPFWTRGVGAISLYRDKFFGSFSLVKHWNFSVKIDISLKISLSEISDFFLKMHNKTLDSLLVFGVKHNKCAFLWKK